MSRILDAHRKRMWQEVEEYGYEGLKRARDERFVTKWAKKGLIEWHHLEALDWLIRRLERSQGSVGGLGERVAISRSPDATRVAQEDASRAYNAALMAVHVRAGSKCYQALYVLTHEPRILKEALRRELECRDSMVLPIVLNALEELSLYLDAVAQDRLSWNKNAAR